MILFSPRHVQPILSGLKTKTRRIGDRRWNVNSVHKAKIKMLKPDYFAHLRILTLHREPLGAMTGKDAREEGGYTLEGYRGEWERIHGKGSWDPRRVVWVVQFERVFCMGDICRHCWQFVGCTAKNCCVNQLFDGGDEYAGASEIINFCCRRMCGHDREYHEKHCTVKKSGAGRGYVLRDEKKVVEKDGNGLIIKRLTDWC